MSSKPVLLLLHGALGDKRQLVPIKDYLSSVYDVHSLNFSGHGGESMPALFSIELFTENLMEYLEEYNLKNVKIFGYSMGGYVALNVARFTQRIGCIITYGTKFHWTPDSAQHEIKKLDPEKIRQKVPVFTENLKKRHTPNNWGIVVEKTAKMMIDLGNSPTLTKENLSQIHIPVTILLGGKDNMVTQNESKEAASYLPNGQFKILPEQPHPIEGVDIKLIIESLSP